MHDMGPAYSIAQPSGPLGLTHPIAGYTTLATSAGIAGQAAIGLSGRIAFSGPPQLNPDLGKDPFRNASERVQNGVKTLRAQVNSAKNQLRFRLGAQAHLRSAEHYYSQGMLESVNPIGASSADLTLQGNIGVEVKYWSAEYLNDNMRMLVNQLSNSYSTYDQVVLQFYQTTYETPVTAEMIPQIYEWLAGLEVDTTNLIIQVVEHGLIIP
jgi:hypothetical protein